ncbi:hypothetical protein [Gemmata sp.]|uniref:hypothetical protein n=1 Tax=Gemmata sp. TaxID=1914242 RepID=UPI003F700907
MTTDCVRLIRRLHRAANAVEVRAIGGGVGSDNDAAFEQQLADLHLLVVADLRTDHSAPKRVVLDLRQLAGLSDRMVGGLVRLDRFLRAARTELVVVAGQGTGFDAIRTRPLDRVLSVAADPAALLRDYGIELSLRASSLPEEETVTFTAEELREMESAGVTLGDAIRMLEEDEPRG